MNTITKSYSSITLWCHKRLLHLFSPLSCQEGNGKPPVPPILRRRTKLSPEDRMREMLENVGDANKEPLQKNELNDFNKAGIISDMDKPAANGDKISDVKKPKLPWKFGKRRSLSPMSRVQGMMEDQDKNDK